MKSHVYALESHNLNSFTPYYDDLPGYVLLKNQLSSEANHDFIYYSNCTWSKLFEMLYQQ